MYRKKTHIHFVGIGGIGMSGIAIVLRNQGYEVSGCDKDIHQATIYELQKRGCAIYEGNNTALCHEPAIDVVVYSSAIARINPEITAAQSRGVPTIPRALMLAELMRTKFSVAIAGSHGKTTTTSLISHILIEAQLDPTVIIGGHLKNISTNARLGTGDFLIAEADESDRSFLNLYASLAIITNIDLEHLETYQNLDDVKQTFKQFITNLPFYGKAILCIDDENVRSLLPIAHIKTITYSLTPEADIWASDIILNPTSSQFTVHYKDIKYNTDTILGTITTSLLGRHNILNSLAAIALTKELGVSFDTIAQAITNFKGIERRFCYHGTFKQAELFDDYGHHPKEILSTLIVARRRAKNKLIVVFQPHRYTRTYHLWNDFLDVFEKSCIDHLIITDIYAASESPIAQVTSENFVTTLKERRPGFSVSYAPYEENFKSIINNLTPLLAPDDLVLFLGAGKLNLLAHELATYETENYRLNTIDIKEKTLT